jgi:hypothetical protein
MERILIQKGLGEKKEKKKKRLNKLFLICLCPRAEAEIFFRVG